MITAESLCKALFDKTHTDVDGEMIKTGEGNVIKVLVFDPECDHYDVVCTFNLDTFEIDGEVFSKEIIEYYWGMGIIADEYSFPTVAGIFEDMIEEEHGKTCGELNRDKWIKRFLDEVPEDEFVEFLIFEIFDAYATYLHTEVVLLHGLVSDKWGMDGTLNWVKACVV